jgi:hypothetical protein
MSTDTATTTSGPRTHCPNCGAKLKRPDLSLCAYCATPLQLGGKLDTARDETVLRLKRLRENPQFGTLSQWTPTDQEYLDAARRVRGFAALWFTLAVVAGLVAWARVGTPGDFVWYALTGLFLVATLVLLVRSWSIQRTDADKVMLRRPAIVVERRSETLAEAQGNPTIYFFTLRFDDGSEGEFRWPGQGTLYEPLTNGMTGVAFTRGERLVEFRRL